MKKMRFFISVCFFVFWSDGMMALPKSTLSSDGFNQSVNAGTEIALGIRYQQQASYQLVKGDKPASETGWESHSTLTTGLFPLVAGEQVRLSYVAKAEGKEGQQPVLWTEIRYFNQNGVNVKITGGRRQVVPHDWHKHVIDLSPVKNDIAYAEVWFIKYESGQGDDEDSESSDKYESAIYLSDIELRRENTVVSEP